MAQRSIQTIGAQELPANQAGGQQFMLFVLIS